MKVKKVVKRLDKVVAMLSDIIKQYAPSDRHVRDVLGAAKTSVVRAKAAVNSSVSPRAAMKASVAVKRTTLKRVTEAARKGASALAKRRRVVNSKGVHARKKSAVNLSASPGTAAKKSLVVEKTKPKRIVASARKEFSAIATKRASSGEMVAQPSAPSEAFGDRGQNSATNSIASGETTSRV